ncbi:MAG: ATP synthase F1 subunit epsilon [Anaerolineales bacterium]|nr:ATP synthase F1 subunit epsilon [Anaerolineales bacterium]MCS7247031.1 ATP synthase F1 subunit epsilon [Anaerolineales bacterium]MDW8160842.1 ATP synthase F1 subunit epsilon [Anaerolineales bacterium]MDW8446802.1 ATP synthase F1 subunit epsilon [Anaerolineales bacterium]
MPIWCEIISQDRVVFEGEADIVILPGSEGEMGILPNHAPLLSTLNYGVMKVRRHGKEQFFTVAGGIVEVRPDRVVVLTDAAENIEEIDVQRAEEAKRRAEEYLKAGPPPDTDEYLAMEAALRRSNLRLEAARKYRGPSMPSYRREGS